MLGIGLGTWMQILVYVFNFFTSLIFYLPLFYHQVAVCQPLLK